MLSYPRILSALVVIWGVRALVEAAVTGDWKWAGFAVIWLAIAVHLALLRHVTVAGLGLVAVIGVELLIRGPQLSGLELLAWMSLAVSLTEGRPPERALLLRTTATTVYAFAALTKLNPSWLAGDGISGLISRQPQLAALGFVADSNELSVAAAIAVILTEAGLAVALWFRPTRTGAAAVGVIMHILFIVGAAPNPWAATHLMIFNLGLVACYPAFWADIRVPGPAEATASPVA